MEEHETVEGEAADLNRAGARLQAARKDAGLKIEQIAAETRIPQRHLVSIEAGDYGKLPSRTYAIGFTRTYARVLGLDERELLDQVRAELAESERDGRAAPAKFEPGDPARVPSRRLAWFSAAAVVLLLVGGFSFYRSYFAPGIGPAPLADESEQVAAAEQPPSAQRAAAQPAINPDGQVVFTSELDGTWVKFYDASGERLYEAQMAKGDSFAVPADAQGPQIWTGRPYALAITIGGKPVPKLSEEDEIVRDVAVTAKALLARGQAPATRAPAAAPETSPAGPT
ncbi:MAG: helix-turn-helix domain-containing protein [Qipengyuania sp.]